MIVSGDVDLKRTTAVAVAVVDVALDWALTVFEQMVEVSLIYDSGLSARVSFSYFVRPSLMILTIERVVLFVGQKLNQNKTNSEHRILVLTLLSSTQLIRIR